MKKLTFFLFGFVLGVFALALSASGPAIAGLFLEPSAAPLPPCGLAEAGTFMVRQLPAPFPPGGFPDPAILLFCDGYQWQVMVTVPALGV